MLIQPQFPQHLECPKCGKQTIVQRDRDVYRCINCGFRRDLSEPRLGNLGDAILIIFVVLLLLIALVQYERYQSKIYFPDRETRQAPQWK